MNNCYILQGEHKETRKSSTLLPYFLFAKGNLRAWIHSAVLHFPSAHVTKVETLREVTELPLDL